MRRLLVLATLFLLSVIAFPSHASHGGRLCSFTDGAYYRANLSAQLEHLELSLQDVNTGETIAILDTHIQTVLDGTRAVFPSFSWSSNCRYLFVIDQYRDDGEAYRRYLGIYDTIEMRQVAIWRGRDYWFSWDYSPDGTTFFFRSAAEGSYLMGDGWQAPVRIAEAYPYQESQTIWRDWDLERREFLVSFRVSPHQVHIFDMNNGSLKQVVSQPESCQGHLNHQRVNENRFLLVYPSFTSSDFTACVNIVNRETGQDIIINAGDRSTYEADLIALSPDGRYLVIGLAAISVWDLANLPADLEARQPILRHEGPIGLIGAIHFIDNDTVETTSADGVQRWNILTGAIENE